jgi:hypothetical protein
MTVDHRKSDDAVEKQDAFVTSTSGMKARIPTTKGWEICIQWKDGSSNWLEMKDEKMRIQYNWLNMQSGTRSTTNQRSHGGFLIL